MLTPIGGKGFGGYPLARASGWSEPWLTRMGGTLVIEPTQVYDFPGGKGNSRRDFETSCDFLT